MTRERKFETSGCIKKHSAPLNKIISLVTFSLKELFFFY